MEEVVSTPKIKSVKCNTNHNFLLLVYPLKRRVASRQTVLDGIESVDIDSLLRVVEVEGLPSMIHL
jgi:hypothetical protein